MVTRKDNMPTATILKSRELEPSEADNYESEVVRLANFAGMVLAELAGPAPNEEKLFWILQHGRATGLIRSVGSPHSAFRVKDPNGREWGYAMTPFGNAAAESASTVFPGHFAAMPGTSA